MSRALVSTGADRDLLACVAGAVLLPGTGPHRVLVTSRHTLAGLGARLVDVTVLDVADAVALLETALRAARPDDDRITADPAAAQRLAEACGGLPLALQITASILIADPALAAAELGEELGMESARLERLAYDDGSGIAATSVAAAFELSYRRLEQVPARVFRLLPVDPGPDMSTVAAANLADLPLSTVRGVLAGLARAHLIEAAPGGGGRWRMHDLLRLYAQKLSGDHAPADHREHGRDRLFAYYMTTADAADDHLQAASAPTAPGGFIARDDALNWLDTERATLVAVVKVAAATGRDEIACRLPIALARYFNWRRRFDDWLVTTRISLRAARRLSDRRREAVALNNLGAVLREMRRFEEAISAHEEAVSIYRDTGDRHGQGSALNNLGIAIPKGWPRANEAIAALRRAAAIFQETGDRHAEGSTMNNLSVTLVNVQRFEEAIAAHQTAADIFQETGDRHAEGSALNGLGVALREAGRSQKAIAAHQKAVSIFRKTGDRHAEASALNNLGQGLVKMRRFNEAIAAFERATALYGEVGDSGAEWETRNNAEKARAARQAF